ncbi:ABC transporter substrate-binding protein [Frankia gtarii]|uniref:ABC transporter substrate-binding protein n=1 Tax=Frankia gtarii TaxID=2950102 RepID=UPI0021C03382|nr:ABC transporter substrate-binding protein [Frankia gtarii]
MTPSEVRVGLIYPDGGGVGAEAFSAARSAVQARIGAANASGGVHGRKIDVVWRDDDGSPSTFVTVSQELLHTVGVFGLIAQSGTVTASADRLDAEGIPMTGIAAEAVWGEHRNMFTFGAVSPKGESVSTFGIYARRLGATRVAVLQDELSISSQEFGRRIAESLQSQGISVVRTVNYGIEESRPDLVAAQIRDSGADALVGAVSAQTFIDVYGAAKQAGVNFKVALGAAGYNRQLLAKNGPAMAGMSLFVNYTPFDQPSTALTAYRDAMHRYAPEVGETDSEVALASYVTTDEFIRGLELAGACPTRKAFIDNLRTVKDYNAGGLIPSTDLRAPEAINLCYAFVRVNGAGTRFEVVPNQGAPDPNQWCGTQLPAG